MAKELDPNEFITCEAKVTTLQEVVAMAAHHQYRDHIIRRKDLSWENLEYSILRLSAFGQGVNNQIREYEYLDVPIPKELPDYLKKYACDENLIKSLIKEDRHEKAAKGVLTNLFIQKVALIFAFSPYKYGEFLLEYFPEGITEDSMWVLREIIRVDGPMYKMPTMICKPLEEMSITPENIMKILSFPHLSLQDNNKYLVAYTQSWEKGQRDIQSVAKIGRFANTYFTHLSPKDVKELVNEFNAKYVDIDVQFARTRNEIKKIYTLDTTDWGSCMQGWVEDEGDRKFECEDEDIHPCEVYASPDCSVAYIVGPDDRLQARSVINEKRKEYVRIYGNEILKNLLEAQGYTKGDLDGCRILKIPYEDGFVGPYIDGDAHKVEDSGDPDYFTVVECGGFGDAQSTRGLLNTTHVQCSFCGDYEHEDDIRHTHDAMEVCEGCVNNGKVVVAYVIDPSSNSFFGPQDLVAANEVTSVRGLDYPVANWLLEEIADHSDKDDEWILLDEAIYCIDINDVVHPDDYDLYFSREDEEWYFDKTNAPEFAEDDNEEVA